MPKDLDVFYVKDGYGMQVTHEGKIAQIRDRLLTVLETVSELSETPKDAVA